MAYGREPSERGGVIDPTDVRGAGSMEWGDLIGIQADDPMVSGYANNPEQNPWGRVITTSGGQAGPASDVIATPEGSAPAGIDSWRDLLNLKGSPTPWILILLIAGLFLIHFTVNVQGGARVGR